MPSTPSSLTLALLFLGSPLCCLPGVAGILFRVANIPGGSQVGGYADGTWSDAASGSYGADRDLQWMAGQPLPPSDPEPIGLTLPMGPAVATLFQAGISGERVGTVEIHFTATVAPPDEIAAYAVILLENAAVKSCTLGGSADERPDIDVMFVYDRITIINRHVGSPTLTTTAIWDLVRQKGVSDTVEGNVAPLINAPASASVLENGSVAIPFGVTDFDGPAAAISVTASSSDSSLIAAGGLQVTGSGANRTLTITPVSGQRGTATVTLFSADGEGGNSKVDLVVTVEPLNHPPSIAPVDPVSVAANAGTAVIPLAVSDQDDALSSLTLTATSSNDVLLPPAGLEPVFDGTNWSLKVAPAADQGGKATITVTATDPSGGSGKRDILFMVQDPVNLPPDNIALSPALIDENSAPETLVGTLSASDPEDNTPITFALVPPSDSRFVLTEGNHIEVATGAVLDYESSSTASITVLATDSKGEGAAAALEITIRNVNEAPLIQLPTLNFVEAETPTPIAGVVLGDPDAGTEAVRLELTATHGTLSLDDSGPLAGTITGNGGANLVVDAPLADLNQVLAAGGLVFTSTAGYGGAASISFLLNDLGHTGAGSPQQASAALAFMITLDPYEAWRRTVFNAAQLADPLVSGPLADVDQDGLVTIGEYLRGKNPLNPGDANSDLIFETVNDGGMQYIELTFIRRVPSLDPRTVLDVEFATDLSGWMSGPAYLEERLVEVLGDDLERVTMRATAPLADEPKQFVQFRFTRN